MMEEHQPKEEVAFIKNEEEMLQQLQRMQELQQQHGFQVPKTESGSGHNNNYIDTENSVNVSTAEIVKNENGSNPLVYNHVVSKQENCASYVQPHQLPQQHHQQQQQHQQFYQINSRVDGQQMFAYSNLSSEHPSGSSPVARPLTSCTECPYQAVSQEELKRHIVLTHIQSSDDESGTKRKKTKKYSRKSDADNAMRQAQIPQPRTSYAFFVQICHDVHRRKHPDQKVEFSEFSRKCSARWKTMTLGERKRFEEMAEQDKTRYDLQMKPPSTPDGVTPKRKKIKKDPNQPKRSLTPFFFFCAENRNKIKEKDPTRSVGDIAKILGAQWSVLTPEEKQPYEVLAVADKERYEREMAEYTSNLTGHDRSESPAKTPSPSKMPSPSVKHDSFYAHHSQQQQHQQQHTTLNVEQHLMSPTGAHTDLRHFHTDSSDRRTPTQSPTNTSALNFSSPASVSPHGVASVTSPSSSVSTYSDMHMRFSSPPIVAPSSTPDSRSSEHALASVAAHSNLTESNESAINF